MIKAEEAFKKQRQQQDMARVTEAMARSIPLTQKLLMQVLKEEKKAKLKSTYHRNAIKAGHIPVYSRIRSLENACNKVQMMVGGQSVDNGIEGGAAENFFAGLKTSSAMELWKEFSGWDDSTEIPKEADIKTFEFAMSSKIISSPNWPALMRAIAKYPDGTREVDWCRLHGKYALCGEILDGSQKCYTKIQHRDLDVTKDLPWGMKIPLNTTYPPQDAKEEGKQALSRIEFNSSSWKAKLCANGTQVPLHTLFKDYSHGFEVASKVAITKEEWTVLHGMVSEESFDLSAHIMSLRASAYANDRNQASAAQGITSSLIRAALPSLTTSPMRKRRIDVSEVAESHHAESRVAESHHAESPVAESHHAESPVEEVKDDAEGKEEPDDKVDGSELCPLPKARPEVDEELPDDM